MEEDFYKATLAGMTLFAVCIVYAAIKSLWKWSKEVH